MIRLIAVLGGVAMLASVAHVTVQAVGGYTTSAGTLVVAIAVGVAIGSVVLGSALAEGRRGLAIFLGLGLLCGELFGLAGTAERIIANREAQQAPARAATAAQAKAEARVAEAVAVLASKPTTSDRLNRALAAKDAADKAAVEKAAERGCAANCRLLLEQQVDAASQEVAAARKALADERAAAEQVVAKAQADLAAITLPGTSGTALADRLGIAPWAFDLIVAALGSLGLNGLAAGMIVFGCHRHRHRATPEHRAQPSETRQDAIEELHAVDVVEPEQQVIAPPARTGSVSRFVLEMVEPAKGKRVEWGDIYRAYLAWCAGRGLEPVRPADFGEALNIVCQKGGIRTLRSGDKVFCTNSRLAQPLDHAATA